MYEVYDCYIFNISHAIENSDIVLNLGHYSFIIIIIVNSCLAHIHYGTMCFTFIEILQEELKCTNIKLKCMKKWIYT